MKFTIVSHDRKQTWQCDSRSNAQERVKSVKSMLSDPSAVEIVKGDYDDYESYAAGAIDNADDGDVDAEVIDHTTDGGQAVAQKPETEPPTPQQVDDAVAAVDKLGESLESDPLNILPGHMKDSIQGTPAINKRGYAMIAERYGIEATATIESYPWDNDEQRCVAKAVATTDDGKQYTGWATACKSDGDMPAQIIELAETRALKRSVSWASGVGVVSYVELSDQLE